MTPDNTLISQRPLFVSPKLGPWQTQISNADRVKRNLHSLDFPLHPDPVLGHFPEHSWQDKAVEQEDPHGQPDILLK